RGFESHVGHGGGNDGVHAHVTGEQEHDCVAVHDVALFVGEESAVGVSVEGDAERSGGGGDLGGDDCGLKRAAVLVDVASVGRGVGDLHVHGEASEKIFGDGAGSAVGRIHDGGDAAKLGYVHERKEPVDVLLAEGFVAGGRRKVGAPVDVLGVDAGEDLGL